MAPNRNIRLLLVVLALLALVGGIATIVRRPSDTPPEHRPPQQSPPKNADITLHNARFTEMRDGLVVWEMVADEASYNKSGDLAQLSGINLNLAARRHTGSTRVTARNGHYDNRSKNITLHGNVHVETENGARFDTEKLEYIATKATFVSSESVLFTHQRLSLQAIGMQLDTRNQTVRFSHSIEAIVAGIKP